jgi:hypothetical protein
MGRLGKSPVNQPKVELGTADAKQVVQAERSAKRNRGREVSMSKFVRRSALGVTVAALVLGASAPAFALSGQTVFADGSSMKLDQSTGKYCLTQNVTGSHVPQVTCQTKADWAKDGLSITVK